MVCMTLSWRAMDSNPRSLARNSRFLLRKANCGTERGQPKRVVSCAVPMVRIHLPPADSQSLSRSRFRRSRTRLSARVWAAGLATGSAETRQAFHCAPTGGNISVGPYSSTAVPLRWSTKMPRRSRQSWVFSAVERAWVFEFGSGLSKAEHDPLIVPGKRQT
jgi:hypothetical protein